MQSRKSHFFSILVSFLSQASLFDLPWLHAGQVFWGFLSWAPTHMICLDHGGLVGEMGYRLMSLTQAAHASYHSYSLYSWRACAAPACWAHPTSPAFYTYIQRKEVKTAGQQMIWEGVDDRSLWGCHTPKRKSFICLNLSVTNSGGLFHTHLVEWLPSRTLYQKS